MGILMMVNRQGTLFQSNGLRDYSFSFRITNGLVKNKQKETIKMEHLLFLFHRCACIWAEIFKYKIL